MESFDLNNIATPVSYLIYLLYMNKITHSYLSSSMWIKYADDRNNYLRSMYMKNKTHKWSAKYKKSIDCKNPRGFSQKQHCKYGRNRGTVKNKKPIRKRL